MNRILELQLTYLLNQILNQGKRHNPAYILLENEKYYLAMLIDNRKYHNDQIKFSFVRKDSDSSKYILRVTNMSIDLTPMHVLEHLKNKYLSFFETLSNLEISEKTCPRKEFEKHYDDFYRSKRQLHSDKEVFFEMNQSKKSIASYENQPHQNTSHLVKPRNEKEKRLAVLERETFNNPKFWKYQL